MDKSLNQVIKTFEDWATAHAGLNDFDMAPITEFTANNNLYPFMWVMATPATFLQNMVSIGLNVYFLDRLEADGSNQLSVLSNMLLIGGDFVTTFNNQIARLDYGFNISANNVFNPIVFSFDDVVAGYQTSIIVEIPERYQMNKVSGVSR